jgi:hypothetical protein
MQRAWDHEQEEPASEYPSDAYGDPMDALLLTPPLPDVIATAVADLPKQPCGTCDETRQLRSQLIKFFFDDETPKRIESTMMKLLLDGATDEQMAQVRNWLGKRAA